MDKKYICTLSKELKECNYRSGDSCNFKEGKCGFRKEDKKSGQYKRESRWYEKYQK